MRSDPRLVRLVLCTGDGEVLGALPTFEAPTPWWPDVEPFEGVVVLRLLDVDGDVVTYLAEPDGPVPALEPVDVVLDDDPLRAPWARPGGPAAILAWADGVVERVGPARQVKTWNLSSVWALPTAEGTVWCKSVPPFLAHEAAVIRLVHPELVLGSVPGTVLLADVPGDDQWDAPPGRLVRMVDDLVALQARWADRVPELLAAGLPDQRGHALTSALATMVERDDVRSTLTPDERAAADRLVADLPRRFDALAACGIPETLVHGDFHPGNWRGDVLLDWGDSVVGHPLLDAAAFPPNAGAWSSAWRRHRPGSDPERALELVGPVAELRSALVYRTFLDGIEASERRYHEADVPDRIRRALAQAG